MGPGSGTAVLDVARHRGDRAGNVATVHVARHRRDRAGNVAGDFHVTGLGADIADIASHGNLVADIGLELLERTVDHDVDFLGVRGEVLPVNADLTTTNGDDATSGSLDDDPVDHDSVHLKYPLR